MWNGYELKTLHLPSLIPPSKVAARCHNFIQTICITVACGIVGRVKLFRFFSGLLSDRTHWYIGHEARWHGGTDKRPRRRSDHSSLVVLYCWVCLNHLRIYSLKLGRCLSRDPCHSQFFIPSANMGGEIALSTTIRHIRLDCHFTSLKKVGMKKFDIICSLQGSNLRP